MKYKWNDLSKAEKFILVGQLLFTILTITAALLQLTGLWEKANILAVPSAGMAILLQSLAQRKTNRFAAITGIIVSLCIFIMYLFGLFLK